MPNPCVPAAEIGLSKDDFEAGLLRLDRDLKSLRSAAATVSDRGRALIDRLTSMKQNSATLEGLRSAAKHPKLIEAVDRLNELADFVECAWLAARGLERQGDRAILSVMLDHAVAGLRELSERLDPSHG